MSAYEIYRKTTVGLALEETLDELVMGGVVEPTTGVMVLKMFDQAISEQLQKNVKTKCTIKGDVHTYRCCDEVWTFVLKTPQIKLDNNDIIRSDALKVVAVTGKGSEDDHKGDKDK